MRANTVRFSIKVARLLSILVDDSGRDTSSSKLLVVEWESIHKKSFHKNRMDSVRGPIECGT